uniref:Uncharacterized protein n=1 Tax=Utricularia reniformis TaxID=192314 RepID=A0A1Y0B2P0_9LAMI|nr:hypothetical protein AEK19_MT1466 [Utricularia reniformis]ART31657.1 hypothetical protein AEK19_MT1466 [Utricularia reniformis]
MPLGSGGCVYLNGCSSPVRDSSRQVPHSWRTKHVGIGG